MSGKESSVEFMSEINEKKLPSNSHLFGLDGIRALSIVLVLASHVGNFNFGPNKISSAANHYGGFGVEIFFVLSGFLITWLLIREEGKNGKIDYRAFYIRRAMRILPPAYAYLLVIGIVGIIGTITISVTEILSAAFFFRNWHVGISTLTGHFWSLSIEEQFYLIWPILAFSLPGKLRLPVTLGLCLFAPVWRLIAGKFLGVDNWMRTDLRYDSLLWGALLAFFWVYPPIRDFFYRNPLRNQILFHAAWVIIVVSFVVEAVLQSGFVTLPGPTLRYFLVVILLATVSLGRAGVLSKFLDSGPMVWFGGLSYSLYLWQQIFCYPTDADNPEKQIWIHIFPYNVLLAIGMAAFSYYVIEAPFRKLRAQFRV